MTMDDCDRLISQPHKVIEDLFYCALNTAGATASTDITSILSNFGESTLIDSLQPSFVHKVPILTRKSLGATVAHNTLVRYRGIVQDIFDIEYYCAAYVDTNATTNDKRWILSKYRDTICTENLQHMSNGEVSFNLSDTSSNTVTNLDRLTYLCTPIPGESTWARNYFSDMDDATNGTGCASTAGVDGSRKRGTYSPSCVNGMVTDADTLMDVTEEDMSYKHIKTNATTTAVNANTDTVAAVFFSTSTDGMYDATDEMSCIAKVYDTRESFKLNDMIEIIGVIAIEHCMQAHGVTDIYGDDDDDAYDDAYGTVLPSSSVAPRIHCLSFRRLGSSFPLLKSVHIRSSTNVPATSASTALTLLTATNNIFTTNSIEYINSCVGTLRNIRDNSKSIRDYIISHIAVCINTYSNNVVIAEYVLLVLLSRVSGYSESLPIGCLSLNMCTSSSSGSGSCGSIVDDIKDIVALFMPRCVKIVGNIDTYNSNCFLPSKDYDINRISSSSLQLGNNTVVIVDETCMNEGVLSADGVKSVQALKSVTSRQKLPVLFSFYEVMIPTDYAFIFVTNGASSLLSSQDTVKIQAVPKESHSSSTVDGINSSCCSSSSSSSSSSNDDDEARMHEARLWLSVVRESEAAMDDDMISYIEDDFVKSRQNDSTITPSIFHSWLTLARLVAFSFGSCKIRHEHWCHMRQLEKCRMDYK